MPIKLILREPVEHLGGPGEIVSVAPGYARNYLLPKGLAFEATSGNLKMLENKRKFWAERELHEVEQAQALAQKMAQVELSVTKKAGERQTLFGSVTTAEIVELLAASGFEVDRKKVSLKKPIKTLGAHEFQVKLHRKVSAQLKIEVLPEGGAPAEEPAPVEPAESAEAEAKETKTAGEASGEAPAEASAETADE